MTVTPAHDLAEPAISRTPIRAVGVGHDMALRALLRTAHASGLLHLVLLFAAGVQPSFGQEASDSESYFLQGINAYTNGALQEAHDAFAECLKLQATRTDCMTNLASVLVDMGNDQAAEELYRAVLAVEPGHADAAYNLGLMLQDRGRSSEEAMAEAVHLYKRVVTADPSRWDAWGNLGAAAQELKKEPLVAVRAYQRAVVQLEGEHENSGSEPDPDEVAVLAKLYYGLGMQLDELSDEQCAQLAAGKNALLIGVNEHGLADDGSSITSAAVCKENAQNSMRSALELDPDHAQAEHMLASMIAASGGSSEGSSGSDSADASGRLGRASPAFVKALFDDFSDSFDEKLGSLGYQVPKLVGDTAANYIQSQRQGRPFHTAFDAGCGTGLAGPHLRPLVAGSLIGADLSPKMLEKAKALNVYDGLKAADLVKLSASDMLPPHEAQLGFELVTAADVLVYFGDLLDLITSFSKLSSPSSVLIFSCERATTEEAPDGWRLLSSGRFAHTRAYVEGVAMAAGRYSLVSYEEIIPRVEYGKPVLGHIFVFSRNA